MVWRRKYSWYVWIHTYLALGSAYAKAEYLSKRDGLKAWVVPVPGKFLPGYGRAFWIVTCTRKTEAPGTGWRSLDHNPLPWYLRWQAVLPRFPRRDATQKEGGS